MSVIVSKSCTFLIVRDEEKTSVFSRDERSECNVVAVLYPDGQRRLRVIYSSGMVTKGTEISPDDVRFMTPRHFDSTYSLLMKGQTRHDHATTGYDKTSRRSEDSPVPVGTNRRSLF